MNKDFWYRLGHSFILPNITSCAVGAGATLVGIFAPVGWNISDKVARALTYFGLGLILIGIIVAFWRYLKNPIEQKKQVFKIVSILSDSFKRLEHLAYLAPSQIELEKLGVISAKISGLNKIAPLNKNIKTKKGLKTALGKTIDQEIPEKLGIKEKDCDQIRRIKDISLILDCDGVGLKQKRTGDPVYRKLKNAIELYYQQNSDFIDKELNSLIQQSIDFNESAANYLVFLRASAPAFDLLKNLGLADILPISLTIGLESCSDDIRQVSKRLIIKVSDNIKIKVSGTRQQAISSAKERAATRD